MPPLPVKSSGVLLEQRRAGARLPPAADAAGDQLAVLQRPARVPALRLLPVLHVRVPREVDVDGDDAAAWRKRPAAARSGPSSYVARVETDRRGRATGVAYFDARKRLQLQRARAVVLCANGAETPRLLLNSESSRFPNGLANSSGVVGKYLMFNTYFGVNAQFEHPLNEFKSVQNTRMVLDFYETDPKRGFYGGGGIDARFGKYPITFALGGLPPGSPTWGEGFARGLAEQFTRTMFFGTHGTSLPLETNSVTIDPALKDAWGLPCMRVTYQDHPDDLKSRRVPGRARDWRSRRPPARSRPGPSRSSRRRSRCTCSGRAGWATIRGRRSSTAITARTTCRTSSSATAAAWSRRRAASRPRRSRRSAFRAGEHIAAFARRGEIWREQRTDRSRGVGWKVARHTI